MEIKEKLIAGILKIFRSLPPESQGQVAKMITGDHNSPEKLILKKLKEFDYEFLKQTFFNVKNFVDERSLSDKEKSDMEHNVKKLKGKMDQDMAYAVATKFAKKGKRFK